MALSPLAAFDDLEAWMGRPVSNYPRAEAILSAASTLVRTHTGRLWVDAEGNPEDGISEIKLQAAREVVVMVADRVYNNPRGTTQETAGPYSRSVAAWAALGMSLTDSEIAMLGGSLEGGIPGLSSVRVVAPAAASGSRHYRYPWWDESDEELI